MTRYAFAEKLIKQGNRYFVQIPFNVWEECGQTGLIPIKVFMQDCIFECRLVPKGEGVYCIPITKCVLAQIDSSNEIDLSFEIIDGLTRINHDSPYTIEHPIRKVDSIKPVTYPKDGYCGQICVAMLTGLSVDEVIEKMQSKAWQCSFSKILETLDYYGIAHGDKIVYTREKEVSLPACCIVNIRTGNKNHLALYYKGKYYDTIEMQTEKIVGYLKICVV